MHTLGGWLLFIGLVALAAGIWKKIQAAKIISAPLVKTGDAASKGASVAGPKGTISVEGMAVCAESVCSPITGTECLYYEYSLTEAWDEKVYNEETQKEETKSRQVTLMERKSAASFSIDDGTGPISVDASTGGEFDLAQTFKESQGGTLGMFKEFASGLKDIVKGRNPTLTFGNLKVVSRERSSGLAEDITSALLDSGSSDKRVLEIYEGNTLVKTYKGGKDVDTKMTVKEEVLKTNQKLYVCGRMLESGGIGAPGWTTLLISCKSRDQLLGASVKWTKELLVGGGVSTAIGMLLYKPVLGICLIVLAAVGFVVFKKFRPQIEVLGTRLSQWCSRLKHKLESHFPSRRTNSPS